jgi:hypothetical protein
MIGIPTTMSGSVVVQTLEVEPIRAWKSPSIRQRAPHSKSRERFCV